MSHMPIFNLPGLPQYDIQRGGDREPCFYAEGDHFFYIYMISKKQQIKPMCSSFYSILVIAVF